MKNRQDPVTRNVSSARCIFIFLSFLSFVHKIKSALENIFTAWTSLLCQDLILQRCQEGSSCRGTGCAAGGPALIPSGGEGTPSHGGRRLWAPRTRIQVRGGTWASGSIPWRPVTTRGLQADIASPGGRRDPPLWDSAPPSSPKLRSAQAVSQHKSPRRIAPVIMEILVRAGLLLAMRPHASGKEQDTEVLAHQVLQPLIRNFPRGK